MRDEYETPSYRSVGEVIQNLETWESVDFETTSSLLRGELLEIRSSRDGSLLYEEPVGHHSITPGETPKASQKKREYRRELENNGIWTSSRKPLV